MELQRDRRRGDRSEPREAFPGRGGMFLVCVRPVRGPSVLCGVFRSLPIDAERRPPVAITKNVSGRCQMSPGGRISWMTVAAVRYSARAFRRLIPSQCRAGGTGRSRRPHRQPGLVVAPLGQGEGKVTARLRHHLLLHQPRGVGVGAIQAFRSAWQRGSRKTQQALSRPDVGPDDGALRVISAALRFSEVCFCTRHLI